MLTFVFIGAIFIFIAAYFFYGRFLEKRFEINDKHATPSHTDYDGVDWVPTHPAILFGHHFSSIAGAGPIIGPIIAALAFGWAPALLWILIGAIFIGGVQDFSALAASMRRQGRSIAQIARETMSPAAFRLLLTFIWLSLVYVLAVFTDLTADTFVNDGGVATSSLMFIALAIVFGLSVYRMKLRIKNASFFFVPLVFAAIWAGQRLPIPVENLAALIGANPKKAVSMALMVYCFTASTMPVWLLLQPRDYLSSFLLLASVLGGFLGILCGHFPIVYPAFKAWNDPQLGGLFPMLFITIACGACSGFHALVSSGTTSKQLDKESDARKIGYGAMLVEGLVGVIGVIIVAMLPLNGALSGKPPMIIYASGMSGFFEICGASAQTGFAFGLLAISAFILTTLDTATRLGRYIFEEFFGLKGGSMRYLATLATLILPIILVSITLHDAAGHPIPAWKAIWPLFGASNQMLAGLALLVITVWMRKSGKPIAFVLLPMLFMFCVSVWSLLMLIGRYRFSLIGIIAILLLLPAALLLAEATKIMFTQPLRQKGKPS